MYPLRLSAGFPVRRILCLGAHCDDVDIGCGGTLLALRQADAAVAIDWVVFSAPPERARETRVAVEALLGSGENTRLVLRDFRDGHFPACFTELKSAFADLRDLGQPDLILTHHRGDLHQDHRLVGELTWQTFRDHLIWEYEVPKYDGDLGRPNVYMPVPDDLAERKIQVILDSYPSQSDKPWLTGDTLRALMRLRGIEARSARWAEAFHSPKLVVSP